MVEILGIQIIGVFFGLFMLYYSFIHFKRKEFTAKEFVFWILLWVGFSFVAIFPSSVDFITQKFGVIRTMDLFTILGFMVLIGLLVYTYTLVRMNQRKLELIVRKIAKERAKK